MCDVQGIFRYEYSWGPSKGTQDPSAFPPHWPYGHSSVYGGIISRQCRQFTKDVFPLSPSCEADGLAEAVRFPSPLLLRQLTFVQNTPIRNLQERTNGALNVPLLLISYILQSFFFFFDKIHSSILFSKKIENGCCVLSSFNGWWGEIWSEEVWKKVEVIHYKFSHTFHSQRFFFYQFRNYVVLKINL